MNYSDDAWRETAWAQQWRGDHGSLTATISTRGSKFEWSVMIDSTTSHVSGTALSKEIAMQNVKQGALLLDAEASAEWRSNG